jgi:hypothetical protein
MSSSSVTVNYDSDPLLEVNHEGIDYRFDAGKQGTALCISCKPPSSWEWQFIGEAKFDQITLRCAELERPVREYLARELRAALQAE